MLASPNPALTTADDPSAVDRGFPGPLMFWGLGFLYSAFLAVVLQKLVLPLMPDLHAGHGLLQNDAIVFHNIAVAAAEQIRTLGWSAWELFPGAAGNVGVLSALYALFGPDPAWFIPVNAAAHALGALMIYRMGPLLWPGRVGLLGGLMGGVAFLVFPSALQWYGQNHKDAFAIAGVLTMLHAWLAALPSHNRNEQRMWPLAAQMLVGALLLGAVRPYFPVVTTVAFLASLSTLALLSLAKRQLRQDLRGLGRLAVLLCALLGVAAITSQVSITEGVFGDGLTGGPTRLRVDDSGREWQWQNSSNIPAAADRLLARASELRAHFIAFGQSIGAGSGVDEHRAPDNAVSALAYMPRALFIGLFAPFPESWIERVSAPRLIGAVETAIWYFFAIGVVVLTFRTPSRQLLAGLVVCATILTVLSYIHPNVGTLYRQRFGLWQFILMCGAVGWASIILHTLSSATRQREAPPAGSDRTGEGADTPSSRPAGSSVERLAASGAVVVLITLACYLGFLARDLLLVNNLGMNVQLDAFFTAAMIPMFFVTFLAMPLADTLIVPFLQAEERTQRIQLLRSILTVGAVFLGSATLLVVLFAPHAAALVLGDVAPEHIAEAGKMLRWFAPIILFSAWTVIGSAALNALHKSREAALAQLAVPVITILLLTATPPEHAAKAAIAGMLLGTLCNMAVVAFYTRHLGYPLKPITDIARNSLRPALAQYRRLTLAALLSAALVPMNYMFAGSIGAGSVSAWALASKIVILVSGLASVGVSAVILPHLARLVSSGTRRQMRSDTYFLLLAGSWLGGGFALGILLFADPLVSAVFTGDGISDEQIGDLANLVKIGALQLPVVIASALLTKMAVVSGGTSRIVAASALALGANLLINLTLVPLVGITGIAVGALGGAALATVYLAVTTTRQSGLGVRELLALGSSWPVWGAAAIALVSMSDAAMAIAFIAVVAMGWGQLRVWRGTPSQDARDV